MSGVKIQLSAEEQEMAADTGIILTKNRVMAAVLEIFGALSEAQAGRLEKMRQQLPAVVFKHPPKIARGENYQQLPWMMLDYPRVFDAAETVAIRQFFWWGNFFSVSLLVSGEVKNKVMLKMKQWPAGVFICVQASPWDHHFGTDNFLPVANLTAAEITAYAGGQDFLKLSLAVPLKPWNDAQALLYRGFENLLNLLL
jgi:hypothetical protein